MYCKLHFLKYTMQQQRSPQSNFFTLKRNPVPTDSHASFPQACLLACFLPSSFSFSSFLLSFPPVLPFLSVSSSFLPPSSFPSLPPSFPTSLPSFFPFKFNKQLWLATMCQAGHIGGSKVHKIPALPSGTWQSSGGDRQVNRCRQLSSDNPYPNNRRIWSLPSSFRSPLALGYLERGAPESAGPLCTFPSGCCLAVPTFVLIHLSPLCAAGHPQNSTATGRVRVTDPYSKFEREHRISRQGTTSLFFSDSEHFPWTQLGWRRRLNLLSDTCITGLYNRIGFFLLMDGFMFNTRTALRKYHRNTWCVARLRSSVFPTMA